MTIQNLNWPTLADVASRTDATGKTSAIVEILNKQNDILTDMPFYQCNDGTQHQTTVRTGLPSAAWRMLNRGVPKGKSFTAKATDTTGVLEAYSEIDKLLYDLAEDGPGFRMSEATAFIEGMNQQMASAVWYGNTLVDRRIFMGFAPRFSTLDTTLAASGANIVDGGGTGSTNTSMWLVTWGENTAHGLYPKGATAGLKQQNLGEVTLIDEDGGQYQGMREHYQWHCGLSVRDWRYTVRVPNIDVALAATDDTYLKGLIRKLIDASERLQGAGMGRTVWYANRRMRTILRHAILEKVAANLTWDTVEGKRVLMFDEYPVRLSEALLNTEARVV